MSNVNGGLVCEADGSGTVTAHVSGTNVAHHAIVSLNGQDALELGKGDHSYTLSANFPQGTEVFLNVSRPQTGRDNVLIKVLTVDCPPPTTATPTTAVPTPTTSVVPVIGTQRVVHALPATGDSPVPGALAAGGIILAGAFLIAAARRPRRKVS